jgi:hypothetical protein
MPLRTLMVSACSSVYFADWLDMLDSVEALGLREAFDCGLIDLGLTDEQVALVRARDVQRAEGTWPFEPPRDKRERHHIGFGGKPFLPRYFPGYEMYAWMDADTWAQTPVFWERVRDGALRDGASFPWEVDADYGPVAWHLYRWLLGNTWLGLRNPATAWRVATAPITNHGIFAMRADSPLWGEWQQLIAEMVGRAQKIVAFDQLSLAVLLFERKHRWDGPDATHNWSCQRAVPAWDASRRLFVSPSAPHRVIHALHLTNYTRGRMLRLRCTDGASFEGTLHPPGGHMDRRVRGLSAESRPKAELAAG